MRGWGAFGIIVWAEGGEGCGIRVLGGGDKRGQKRVGEQRAGVGGGFRGPEARGVKPCGKARREWQEHHACSLGDEKIQR